MVDFFLNFKYNILNNKGGSMKTKRALVITNNELLDQETNDKINHDYDMTIDDWINEVNQFTARLEEKYKNYVPEQDSDLDVIEEDLNDDNPFEGIVCDLPPLTDEEEAELAKQYGITG